MISVLVLDVASSHFLRPKRIYRWTMVFAGVKARCVFSARQNDLVLFSRWQSYSGSSGSSGSSGRRGNGGCSSSRTISSSRRSSGIVVVVAAEHARCFFWAEQNASTRHAPSVPTLVSGAGP